MAWQSGRGSGTRLPQGPSWWRLPGRGKALPPEATEVGSPTLIDPLNYDPLNVPSLIGPQVYWTGVVENFTPSVREPNIIASTTEQGVTMSVQPVTDYTPVVSGNVVAGNANIATGAPPGVRMSTVMRAFEDQLSRFQDFLLGAP